MYRHRQKSPPLKNSSSRIMKITQHHKKNSVHWARLLYLYVPGVTESASEVRLTLSGQSRSHFKVIFKKNHSSGEVWCIYRFSRSLKSYLVLIGESESLYKFSVILSLNWQKKYLSKENCMRYMFYRTLYVNSGSIRYFQVW